MSPTFPVILSSPSGGGKTTISRALLARRTDVGYSVSCTTRAPRKGEVDGRDYHFLTELEFLARRERGDFAESARVHGLWYGTLRSEVEKVLGSGKHVILDIDVQGAAQIHRAFPQAVLVFVLPPSGEALLARLRERGTESAAQLERRLQSAIAELEAAPEYQYVVVNDDLEAAIARVSGIIDAEAARRDRLMHLERDLRSIVERLEREINA
ncbi:MAG TPA: guanylate kinase [Gemmatimonadaceae bacterium]|nr:guanylate kinase [Gemmatimonadaceae bacterium]